MLCSLGQDHTPGSTSRLEGEGPRPTPTLSSARTTEADALPVWFENWTEFTASTSNPKTCKTDREGAGVRELVGFQGPTAGA